MAQYIVTGGLGSGKTLVSVSKIQEYLLKKRRVAANIDLNIPQLVGWKKQKVECFRLPDEPTKEDMLNLGYGSDKKGEENHGLLVLDEAALFLNTQDFRSQTIKDIRELIVHIRKRRWDIIVIVQHYEILDKQIRNILGEHVVRAKRLDRIRIPFITALFEIIGLNIRFPRIHMADVRYGSAANAPKVDTWTLRGSSLYGAYDTEQAFSSEYDTGLYMYLPPAKLKKPEKQKKKIPMFKQFLLYLSAVMIGSVVTAYTMKPEEKINDNPIPHRATETSTPLETLPFPNGVYISSSFTFDNDISYSFQNQHSIVYPSNYGYTVRAISPCKALVIDPVSRLQKTIRCATATALENGTISNTTPPEFSIFASTDSQESGESKQVDN